MVDAATQRLNMVESQVLTSDVTDRRILRAMRELPRERVRSRADGGARLHGRGGSADARPGAERRWLLAPRVLAKLLQLADIGDGRPRARCRLRQRIFAAVLAGMAKTVVALESDIRLAEQARTNLAALGLDNVERRRRRADGRAGPPRRPTTPSSCEGAVPARARDAVRSVEGRRLSRRHRQSRTAWAKRRSGAAWRARSIRGRPSTPPRRRLPGFERAAVFVF